MEAKAINLMVKCSLKDVVKIFFSKNLQSFKIFCENSKENPNIDTYKNKAIFELFEIISECAKLMYGLKPMVYLPYLDWWSIYYTWTGGLFTISGLVVYLLYLEWWSIYHIWTGGLFIIS